MTYKYMVQASVRDDSAPKDERFKEVLVNIETDTPLVNDDGTAFVEGIYDVQRQIGLNGGFSSVQINKASQIDDQDGLVVIDAD